MSAIESALLTVEVATDGRAPAPYVSLRLSESEESAASVETSLATVQPPAPRLDDLRTHALSVIGSAANVLEELRLAAYRDELERLDEIAEKLEEPLAELRDLMDVPAR